MKDPFAMYAARATGSRCQDCGSRLTSQYSTSECPVCERLVLAQHDVWLHLLGMV